MFGDHGAVVSSGEWEMPRTPCQKGEAAGGEGVGADHTAGRNYSEALQGQH